MSHQEMKGCSGPGRGGTARTATLWDTSSRRNPQRVHPHLTMPRDPQAVAMPVLSQQVHVPAAILPSTVSVQLLASPMAKPGSAGSHGEPRGKRQ